jgi:hypothetical protein
MKLVAYVRSLVSTLFPNGREDKEMDEELVSRVSREEGPLAGSCILLRYLGGYTVSPKLSRGVPDGIARPQSGIRRVPRFLSYTTIVKNLYSSGRRV